jgi:hypothetical protein
MSLAKNGCFSPVGVFGLPVLSKSRGNVEISNCKAASDVLSSESDLSPHGFYHHMVSGKNVH